MREIPISVGSMAGSFGHIRWLNSDPAGEMRWMMGGPFWGRVWFSTDGWHRISGWMW